MCVIITGGTGLIGRALGADLVRDGLEVVALSRSPERHARVMPAGVRLEAWDGRTADGWGHLADGAAAVVNLAGASIGGGRWSAARKAAIRNSRLDAVKAVIAAAQMAPSPPRVLVLSCGVGYYGNRGDEIVDESGAPGDDFAARVLVDVEAEAAKVETLGTRLAVARTGVVLAPTATALALLVLPFRLMAGGRMGSGRQYFSWIHIADEVAALRLLIEDESAQGAINVTSPNPVTNAEFARIAGHVLHRPSLLPAPAWAVRLILGEMSTIVLDGQRVVPRRLPGLGFTFRFPELEGALRDALGRARA